MDRIIEYILGIYRDNGKEKETIILYRGIYRDSIGIIGYILGLYKDNGKENGNYYLGFRGTFPLTNAKSEASDSIPETLRSECLFSLLFYCLTLACRQTL